MKRILIVSHAMELGGAENALLGLLENIDTTKYQVDLFLLRHQGELLPFIPDGVRLLPENSAYACMAIPISQVLKRKKPAIAITRLRGKLAAKRRNKQLGYTDSDIELEYSHKYTYSVMPMISGEEYDLAISFLTPHYYVAERVKAKKKIAWIHTDYSKVQVDRSSQILMWDRFDHIISISEKVTENFLTIFPELKEKICLIGNMIPTRYIEMYSAQEDVSKEMPEDGSIRLLSIGRFCLAKNFDNIPAICRELLKSGLNVKWYIIGFGGDEALIKAKIAEFGMHEHVIILGKKSNPYPYIRACDLYVQPSRYEGKCVSVIEAQSLHKPVVITAYETSNSQLRDGTDGVIVPMDNELCAAGIACLLRDTDKMAELINNTWRTDYSNNLEIMNLYSIM